MKLSVVQLFMLGILAGMGYANPSHGQEFLKTKVTLEMRDASLHSILHQIEKQADISFSYQKEVVSPFNRIDVSFQEETLDNVLRRLLLPRNIRYESLKNKRLILTRGHAPVGEIGDLPSLRPLDKTVTGKIKDEKGEALPGVSILVKGTQQGTITGADGSFSLDVPDEKAVLVFSFVGYATQEVVTGNRTHIEMVLMVDEKALEEVVVVGYGTQKKSDLTGAVGSVSETELLKRPVTSVNQALAGTMPGVNVSVNSGRPGGKTSIRVRGVSSVSSNNNPLYVIDGIILNTVALGNGSNPIDYMDPGNIESIEVLKDASSTAIYGARGANGVVLITTKKGSRNGSTVNYNGFVSAGQLPRKLDVLNSEEFLRVEEILYENAKIMNPGGSYVDPRTKRNDPKLFDANGNPLYDTDWQKEATQTAISQNHQLSIAGGSPQNNYGLFLGSRDDNGILKGTWMKRYSARIFMDTRINKWLSAGGSINYNYQKENQPVIEGGTGINATRSLIQSLPISPVKYPDGSWGKTEDYPGMEGGAQYLQYVDEVTNYYYTQNALANAYANVQVTDGLEFRSSLNTNIINQRNNFYAGGMLPWLSKDQKGIARVSNSHNNSWQFENYMTYNKKLGRNSHFSGLLGASWQYVNLYTVTSQAEGFVDDYYETNNIGVGSNQRPSSSGASAYSFNSYFTRFNYNLNGKYLFTVTARADGSSKFGANNKYALFPSAAMGWIVSNEDFLMNSQTLSKLKLRSSFGYTGNAEIANYNTVTGLTSSSYIFNNARSIGVGIGRIGNRNLQWETNVQFDAGVEIGLFDNRLVLEADFYHRKSKNMLLQAPVPASSGYSSVLQNIGNMENRGLEFSILSHNLHGSRLKWNTNFNLSYNRNRVLRLTGGADIISGNVLSNHFIIREGEPVNSFFGYVHLGTWHTSEVEEAQKYNKKPGDVKYKDVNGDGAINDRDRVIIGNGLPDVYGALINNFSFENFDLTLDLQFMYGNDVNFASKVNAQDRVGITNVYSTVLDAWTPENQNTAIPQLRPSALGLDRNASTDRIYDGSFIRGRNLLIGYNFPTKGKLLDRFKSLRLYASAQNIFLITRYPGYDPEVATSLSQFEQGYDEYGYPKPRTFLLGVNLTF